MKLERTSVSVNFKIPDFPVGLFLMPIISHEQVLLQKKDSSFLWCDTLQCWVSGSQHLKDTCHLHLQGSTSCGTLNHLKMKVNCSFHMLETTYSAMQRHISENCNAQLHNCENLKHTVLQTLHILWHKSAGHKVLCSVLTTL